MEMKEVFIRETFVLENSENFSDNEENENNYGKNFKKEFQTMRIV